MIEQLADDLYIPCVLATFLNVRQLFLVLSRIDEVLVSEAEIIGVALDAFFVFFTWLLSIALFDHIVDSHLDVVHELGRAHALPIGVVLRLCDVWLHFLFFSIDVGHPSLFFRTERAHSRLHIGHLLSERWFARLTSARFCRVVHFEAHLLIATRPPVHLELILYRL